MGQAHPLPRAVATSPTDRLNKPRGKPCRPTTPRASVSAELIAVGHHDLGSSSDTSFEHAAIDEWADPWNDNLKPSV